MFGQRHPQETISLENLGDEVMLRQKKSFFPNRRDSYRFRINNYSERTARFYRFVLPQPTYERRVNIFVQFDNEAAVFRDVRLFKPLGPEDGGGFVAVEPYGEIQICGKDSGDRPVLENWILFFRNNCDTQIKENTFELPLSDSAGLFTLPATVRVGSKLVRRSVGTRLTNAAMDLLMKDEINLEDMRQDLRTVLPEIGGRVLADLPASSSFTGARISDRLYRLELLSAQAHHDSIVEAKEHGAGAELIESARARLSEILKALGEFGTEVENDSRDFNEWKRSALACRPRLEQRFAEFVENPGKYLSSDRNLKFWLDACDLYIVCGQDVRFEKEALDYEASLRDILERAGKEIGDARRELAETRSTVRGAAVERIENAVKEEVNQAAHKRLAELQVIHEFGETIRVAVQTSRRAAEKGVETASRLLDKISPSLPSPAQKPALEEKKGAEEGKASGGSTPDYDPSGS